MDELSAFERRLMAGVEALAGPRRSIDAIAMARAAASHTPTRGSILSRLSGRVGQDRLIRNRRVGGLLTGRDARLLTVFIAMILILALAVSAIVVGSRLVRLPAIFVPPPSAVQSSPQPTLSRGWSTTGDSGQARYLQTATLLRNGNVLVTGGRSDPTKVSGSLSSAELYEPGRGTWRETSSMVSRRSAHSATLLADGKVLVAGGYDDFSALQSAELYDPETGSWTATGKMIEARGYHTATLLPDGRVLVAGGRTNNGSTGHAPTSAELYDPITRNWTPAASMLRGLTFHTATLLSNGQVLVAGSGSNGVRIDTTLTAELYDPLSDLWKATGSMIGPRAYHSATLLPNGQVLAAGGYDSVEGVTGAGSGPASGPALASAELYDPSTGTWSAAGSMTRPRALFTATLLGTGNVIAIGGDDGNGDAYGTSTYSRASGSATAELYDAAAGSWASVSKPAESRALQIAVLLPDAQVLVAGGLSAGQALSAAELYRPE